MKNIMHTMATVVLRVSSLVVEMFDTRTAKLIWRGSSSDTFSDKPDKNIKNLDVRSSLKAFFGDHKTVCYSIN